MVLKIVIHNSTDSANTRAGKNQDIPQQVYVLQFGVLEFTTVIDDDFLPIPKMHVKGYAPEVYCYYYSRTEFGVL